MENSFDLKVSRTHNLNVKEEALNKKWFSGQTDLNIFKLCKSPSLK